MTKMFSEECAAVCLYDIEPATNSLAGFYHNVLRWYQELGCSADKMSVHGPGHSGRPVSFASANAKLKRSGFDGITFLSIYSLTPDARIPLDDYLLSASWSSKFSYACVASRSSIAPLSRSAMLPVVQSIVQAVKPAYGIGYQRDHRLGPVWYAIGICQGLGPSGHGIPGEMSEAEQQEAESISRWGKGMRERVWQKGVLRSVYPWNFLTSFQLVKQVDGIALEQWIRQDVRRGTLGPLCDGVFLWEVTEPNLPQLRAELRQAGVIFDWKTH